ncbi:hypothetical protein P280DRAFT_515607 [Massarina eburnea CBS 473.64]|uniref:AA1-like domain-containing protein n=1 Tax=Massarina eburnea CBS 473.64 TaxID=1395130 RepID=A0A6A6SAG5_9PLEO|nr:hypothetical protein P280DRAFT_515607 [Massarina eburnea CBS 473.64]
MHISSLFFLIPIAHAFTLAHNNEAIPSTSEDTCWLSWSKNPRFQLNQVAYYSLVKFHLSHAEPKYANFNFSLTNTITNDQIKVGPAQCTGTSGWSIVDSDFFNPHQIGQSEFNCNDAAGTTGKTQFTFAKDTTGNKLSINQTWTCGGREFIAFGDTTINLSCHTNTWKDEWYTSAHETVCDKFDIDVGYLVSYAN